MIKKLLIPATLLAFSCAAHAGGFNDNGKVMSSIKFYDVVQHTQPNKVATNFGKPDDIQTFKNAKGDVTGVVWVYRDSVLRQHGMMDAYFFIENGQMKYVSLANAI